MASLTTKKTEEFTEADMKASLRSEAQAMNNMEGKDDKGDVRVSTYASALETFQNMIPKDGGEGGRYNYQSMHLGKGVCTGKTPEDVHRAFLLWCQKPEDREADSFNVSKAFRRLSSFAEYQLRMFDKYFSEPVDIHSEEIRTVATYMDIKIPSDIHAETGSVKWIMDLDTWDLEAFKDPEKSGMSHKGIMQWFWSLMLTSMFDDATCIHGVIIVEAFGNMGISGMMSLQSAFKPIEADINEMFYGITPFKMKACVLVGCPWWLSALIGFMRLFISRKMSQRIKNFSLVSMQEYMGGIENLPEGCLGGTGPYEERYPGVTAGGSDDSVKVAKEEEEEEEEEETLTF